MAIHPSLAEITDRIIERSQKPRADYLARMDAQAARKPTRTGLSCGNLAHGFAAAGDDKARIKSAERANIGIVTAYNDMLSAHQPFQHYPELIKMAARNAGATAQVAGGVSAMCDGVTQGRPGMELSLFSRDIIAQSTAIALSHEMFDAALMLGVCDKIVPGMLIGALAFGHLPTIFVPAGPMSSGITNAEKARVRQAYAEGKASRDELLDAESKSYHSAGTCTFYGTANSNQMLLEMMGLHMPGTAFVPPNTPLRDALTVSATEQVLRITALSDHYRPIGQTVNEKALVNAMVGLAATGGSTNHAIHLMAIGRAAGVLLNWTDLDAISKITPLLARIYPNGAADVNHFHAAGGIGLVMRELLDVGLLHADIACVHGGDLYAQAQEPYLNNLTLTWRAAPTQSLDDTIVRAANNAFDAEGGLRLVQGNLGRAVVKVSAVRPEHRHIRAAAKVFLSQEALEAAFKRGELDCDMVAVIIGQGPQANGMPELHKLTPTLSALQDRGLHVALLTDGRMSGASGKVLAAIHVVPEALAGGLLRQLRDGDMIVIDAQNGLMHVELDAATLAQRTPLALENHSHQFGVGRELFALQRQHSTDAEQGASSLFGALSS